MIVTNSSPLIALGRTGNLYILKSVFDKVLIPETGYEEIMEKEETIEALSLNGAIREKEAISLAAAEKLALLVDDSSAKAYARVAGVEAHGTMHALLIAIKKKIIRKAQARELVGKMIENGFYISSELYSELLRELDF